MVKEFERCGYPVVHICNLTPVSLTVGANRIVQAVSIPYPLGDPGKSAKEQFKLRYALVGTALDALTAPVSGQTVFKTA